MTFNVCQNLFPITLDTLDIFLYTLDILMTHIESIPMEVIMATAEKKATISGIQSHVSLDLWNSSSELECATRRCVQCGDILDPVILHNRHILHEPMTVPRAGNSLSNRSAMEHR